MGTGNTTGKIVGQPPVPEKTAEEANPVVSAETEEEKGFIDSSDLNTEFRGQWLAVSALHHDQYESFRAIAETYGDKALAGFDVAYNSADVQFASVMVRTMGVGRSGGASGAGRKSSAAGGRFRGTEFGMPTPALAGAGGMPYGQGLQIRNAERKIAASSVKNSVTGKKKAEIGSGGKAKGKKNKDGPCMVGPYNAIRKKCPTGSEAHHIVPDYTLRYGRRDEKEKRIKTKPALPTLDSGVSICLTGKERKGFNEHREVHKADKDITRDGKTSKIPGTLTLAYIKNLSISTVARVKPECSAQIVAAVNLQFMGIDHNVLLRATKKPPSSPNVLNVLGKVY